MVHRIEISSNVRDTRSEVLMKTLESKGFENLRDLRIVDVYTVDASLKEDEAQRVASMLTNPLSQRFELDESSIEEEFGHVVEIGSLPGVTDNIGSTARESVEDLLGTQLEGQGVYSSRMVFLSGDLSEESCLEIGESIANPLIQNIKVKNRETFLRDNGMGVSIPKVRIDQQPKVDLVDLINASDNKLATIGKQGIANPDGTRRGPLALDPTYMIAIRDYFVEQGRNPTDLELESIAQTWSEHCKHTIFANPMDDFEEGLYKRFIQGATEKIRTAKGDNDFCISVFTDNSGAIAFDENYLVTDKVETHNSPSALDPFGGAITGIVGVNRDTIGFGLGAKPIANRYGFCFADPMDESPLFKGENKTQRMLSPKRILEGVVKGVNEGGNQSGIPTPQGFVYFDDRFKGKPLVFVGTTGLIPRESAERLSHEKQAMFGDYVVMVGGRVGKDGIHGATFSSEEMDSGSPATAVQIGDPITQKKLSDAIVKEARDLRLYNSVTDNGAGGLSCSVAEMAKESGGCYVNLEKIPLKYPGLDPWEIWISESQERMTLSVPRDKWNEFSELMVRRGVEATIIGEFNDSGKCVVDYEGNNVMDIDMDFLHDGLPKRPLKTTFTKQKHEEPNFSQPDDLTNIMHSMLKRNNITSFEFISQQYDHEVQAGSVIKPLQGKGRINGDATIVRPVLGSEKGVILSHGVNPSYSDIDTFHMATSAIDNAVRNAIAVGASLEKIALLDNFCWCSSNEPERLGQLKRAVMASHDIAVAYGTPFISGKDSMFNDFKGFDENGNPIKISVPPTLLASSIAVIDDVRKAISSDAKISGDLVYVLGENSEELGGSEYFAMRGENLVGERFIGNSVPEVNFERNKILYESLSEAINQELVASAQSVNKGGLGIALAKTAMGGRLGMDVSLGELRDIEMRDDYALFSESQGRLIVTINPEYASKFEKIMEGNSIAKIGVIRNDDKFVVKGRKETAMDTNINEMLTSYKSTFGDY